MKVESESEVAQSCPTPRDPMDCSLPDSSVHGFSRQEYWSGLPLPSPSSLDQELLRMKCSLTPELLLAHQVCVPSKHTKLEIIKTPQK